MSHVRFYFDRVGELVWSQEFLEKRNRRLLINWNPSYLPLRDKMGNSYSVFALHSDYRCAEELEKKGCSIVSYDTIFSYKSSDVDSKFDLCIIGASRCYEQNLAFFGFASQVILPSGVVCVIGPNAWGIRTLEKEFSRYWKLEEPICKFHGRFFWSNVPKSEHLSVELEWERVSATKVQESSGLVTTPGNFSWKNCDQGSEFLISTLEVGGLLKAFLGIGVDLGAGYGFLSKLLLEHRDIKPENIEKIFLLESDSVALSNAKKNIVDSRARFLWGDVSRPYTFKSIKSEGLERNINWVIMNPPFHDIYGDVSLELGLSFFDMAHWLLSSGGSLYWVANKHLPYLPEVRKKFRTLSILAQNSKFVIGHAVK